MGLSQSKKNEDKEFERYIESLDGVKNIQRLYIVKKAAEIFCKNNNVSKEKQNVFQGIYAILEKKLRALEA